LESIYATYLNFMPNALDFNSIECAIFVHKFKLISCTIQTTSHCKWGNSTHHKTHKKLPKKKHRLSKIYTISATLSISHSKEEGTAPSI
jgi:hypothetical protein